MEAMASVIFVCAPPLPGLAPQNTLVRLPGHRRCRLLPSLKRGNVLAAEKALVCRVTDRGPAPPGQDEDGFISDKALQLVLWSMAGVYVLWLFVLPFAPGDPAWAIDAETLSMLLDLSLNFFLILPVTNAAGFHLIESPVLHPTVEALFNLVMGWTLLFGPVLFSDKKRNRFRGSLEALWLGQWLLTNTFLIPYMAVRLNPAPKEPVSPSKLASTILFGTKYIALVGLIVGSLSVAWGIGGRPETTVGDRWEYFVEYVKTDRVGYAFVWDLCLYSVFQPWLIRSNLHNIKNLQIQKTVSILRFVPYVGMVAYLLGLPDADIPGNAPIDDKRS